MSPRHLSDAALSSWADGRAHRGAARHVEHCPLCLDRLEQMTELEPGVRSDIEASLMPLRSLEEALWDRLEARVADREALSLVTDLIDVGPATSMLLLGGAEDDGEHDE